MDKKDNNAWINWAYELELLFKTLSRLIYWLIKDNGPDLQSSSHQPTFDWWCRWGWGRWRCCCSPPRCCSVFADISAVNSFESGLAVFNWQSRIKSARNINLKRMDLTWRASGDWPMFWAAIMRDLLALCSPSAAITLARASRAASASAAMALMSCSGTRTSFTSTLSTLTPHSWVPTASSSYISWAILIRSERISPRVRVPRTFLRVVAARAWKGFS